MRDTARESSATIGSGDGASHHWRGELEGGGGGRGRGCGCGLSSGERWDGGGGGGGGGGEARCRVSGRISVGWCRSSKYTREEEEERERDG